MCKTKLREGEKENPPQLTAGSFSPLIEDTNDRLIFALLEIPSVCQYRAPSGSGQKLTLCHERSNYSPPQMNMAIISLLERGGTCVRFELLSRAAIPSQSRDELGLCSAVFVPCSHPDTSPFSQCVLTSP